MAAHLARVLLSNDAPRPIIFTRTPTPRTRGACERKRRETITAEGGFRVSPFALAPGSAPAFCLNLEEGEGGLRIQSPTRRATPLNSPLPSELPGSRF